MDILVIEDDLRVSELIKRGLEEQGFSATVAYDGVMGKKLALQHPYELIITDIILPKMDGLELCKQLREANLEIPIIMLTALGTTDDKLEGFDAGADDYLVKPFEIRELMARIRVLLKRQSKTPQTYSNVLKYDELELNLQNKTVKRGEVDIDLTPKEFKLLEYLLQNPERVLSRTEIAEKVWDTHFDTGTNFIDVYINYLRKKIDKSFEKKLIHTKSGMGFILKSDL
ncbi:MULTISPECIES: response regulator transcription factor [Flectobacillus]|uniref:Response regulator transcription factor n=3 Tax=Bacteroidota TaxID=976 RepID=A0ABT6Z0A1_9BACT|nr:MULTISPECIES: response regulator transcription factor [Flectobacillus]MDI9863354.1 response regulator transcription factor [Flectobacillus longus]MDI9874031.1 response regulator transcription factor [Flectobacillus rivi]NBB30598.1 response regulator [Cellulophaga sp. BC115SP]